MTLFILDTDHISFFQRGHPLVQKRVTAVSPDQLAVTVISYEEQVRGWLAQIRRANNDQRLIQAYRRLEETLTFYSQIHVLTFDTTAVSYFNQLTQQRIRVGTQDLRIAAIGLAHGAILVTRNMRDFSRIPGLQLEDWSITLHKDE
ncbi:MAG: type II toxin-antitoxin system VapC family toxin [Chloroflexi bacterium]|nr:type II toxin-antitoxin system VapC family toxin [Chloroflexota bacterium]